MRHNSLLLSCSGRLILVGQSWCFLPLNILELCLEAGPSLFGDLVLLIDCNARLSAVGAAPLAFKVGCGTWVSVGWSQVYVDDILTSLRWLLLHRFHWLGRGIAEIGILDSFQLVLFNA